MFRIEGLQNLTLANGTGANDEKGLKFPTWLIDRVRVFHPKMSAHQVIEMLILEELESSSSKNQSAKSSSKEEL